MDEGDRHAALADGGRDALHRAVPDVAAGEDAGDARLEQVRVALELPAPRRSDVRPGQDEAPLVERDLYLFETSVPGIFASGDVRSGPVKRVAAAVGEGSMAIAFVHQYLREHA